mgnify:CR=1 FL=1
MRTIPGMVILNPCDHYEMQAAVRAAVEHKGPCYIRLGRLAVESINNNDDYKFELGKGITLREGTDITIAAYGTMINEAAKAAESLAAEGVSAKVVKLGRVLPLDAEPVLAAAKATGRLVVAEEVCASGCIGGRILASAGGEAGFKCRLLNLGESIVGQGGTDKLRSLAGIDAAGIAAAAKELMA